MLQRDFRLHERTLDSDVAQGSEGFRERLKICSSAKVATPARMG